MTTRAKFTCYEIIESPSGKRVKLSAVTGTSEENQVFFKWTPSASIDMGILNPDVKFEVGKDYYVDFTKAE